MTTPELPKGLEKWAKHYRPGSAATPAEPTRPVSGVGWAAIATDVFDAAYRLSPAPIWAIPTEADLAHLWAKAADYPSKTVEGQTLADDLEAAIVDAAKEWLPPPASTSITVGYDGDELVLARHVADPPASEPEYLEVEAYSHVFRPLVACWLASEAVQPAKPLTAPKAGRAVLPGLRAKGRHVLPALAAEPVSMELPIAAGRQLAPVYLLDMFDQAGGQTLQRGRGAPWPLRLFIAATLHTRATDRVGRYVGYRLPARQVVSWLHPDGWKKHRQRWHTFERALNKLDQLRVYVPGKGRYRLVGVDLIPTHIDEYVDLRVMLPASAQSGPRIDFPTLTRYGHRSGPQYRGYLIACCVLDEAAVNGHPVTADSPPSVARYVRRFTLDELSHAVGYRSTNPRRDRAKTLQVFRQLAADRVIDFVEGPDGYQILGPSTDRPALL